MKVRVKTFDEFWGWLVRKPHVVPNLGCERGKQFTISATGSYGRCIPHANPKSKGSPFTREEALRVWDRYHGARVLARGCPCCDIHLKPTTYAKPNTKNPAPHSWPDFPNMHCAPWIAAAIALFLNEHPCPMGRVNLKRAKTNN